MSRPQNEVPEITKSEWKENRGFCVAVFSDSHGDVLSLQAAVNRLDGIDLIIHLGDNFVDCKSIEKNCNFIQVIKVIGNCDLFFSKKDEKLIEEIIIEIGGAKLYCTHGHIFGRNASMPAYYRAMELGANAALLGHTHISEIEKYGDVLIVNPGSISRPRDGKRRSFALIDIKNSKINAQIIHL